MAGNPNNPPAPALEGLDVAPPPTGTKCADLKGDFGITTRPHDGGSKREDDKNLTDHGNDSHHIIQDAAIEDIIGREVAQAILISAGGEHTICNRRQGARNNGRATIPSTVSEARAKGLPDDIAGGSRVPKAPSSTFGELKKAAKGDLVAGLQGRRKNKAGRAMTTEEAKVLADCLIAEAEEAVNKERKKNGEPPMKDSDTEGIKQPGSCLVLGTLVWLDSSRRLPIEKLKRGMKIETNIGVLEIQRIDICYGSLTEFIVRGESIQMTPSHRVYDKNGTPLTADSLKVGNSIKTFHGDDFVGSVRNIPGDNAAISFGAGQSCMCRIGTNGVWVEFPDTGITVVDVQEIQVY